MVIFYHSNRNPETQALPLIKFLHAELCSMDSTNTHYMVFQTQSHMFGMLNLDQKSEKIHIWLSLGKLHECTHMHACACLRVCVCVCEKSWNENDSLCNSNSF